MLANLTAGVIVLEEAFRVSLANAGAQRILELGAAPLTGRLLTELPRLSEAGPQILQAFADLDATLASARAAPVVCQAVRVRLLLCRCHICLHCWLLICRLRSIMSCLVVAFSCTTSNLHTWCMV